MRKLSYACAVLLSTVIVVFSLVCFAADDSMLTFVPAIASANAVINPVGTYTGSGLVTFGNCACTITNATVTIQDGPVSGGYKLAYSGLNTTNCVAESGQCSWSDMASNIPAVLQNKELMFGNSTRGSYQNSGQTYYYQATTTGSLDLSTATPVFVKSSAHQVTGASESAYNAIVKLTLQKTP